MLLNRGVQCGTGSRSLGSTVSSPTTTSRCSGLRSVALSSRVALAGDWEDCRRTSQALQTAVPKGCSAGGSAPRRGATTMMGNKATGGPFSPLVGVVRDAVGEKEFNKLRGKAISLHSQVIKVFCQQLGVDNKQVQGVIRLAKKNGEKLGFLA